MRDDKTTKKRMVIGFIVICICCGIMHVIMVKKGNLYLERSKPRYNLDKRDLTGTMEDGVGVVKGEVAAVSVDKFFLTLEDGKLQTILLDELESPVVGDIVNVTYAGGKPPKALMIEKAEKE